MTEQRKRRGHGEGGLWQRPDGRWEALLHTGYTPDGKRKRRKAVRHTKTAAAAALKEMGAEEEQGLNPDASRWTVADWLQRWIETEVTATVRPRTQEQYASVVNGHLIPALGNVPLRKLTASDIRAYMKGKLDGGLAARTVGNHHIILRRALEIATRYQYIERNPARLVSSPRYQRYKAQPLTPEEMRQFLGACEGHRLQALFLLSAATGMRIGEVLGLTWEAVDLDAGTVRVEHTLYRIGGEFQLAEPKTEQSRRSIAIPAQVVVALQAHRKRQIEERLASPVWMNEWGLVFTGVHGQPVGDRVVRYEFAALLEAAKITGRRIRLHDLRHGAATYMLATGVPMKVVQEVLGHSQMSITADTYSHVLPELQREAADRIGSVLFGR